MGNRQGYEKEKRENRKALVKKEKQRIDELESMNNKDALVYDISVLKTRIKNCEYDLNSIPGNMMIVNKLDNMKKQLKRLEDDEKLLDSQERFRI